MKRKFVDVQYPMLEHTESVANICIKKTILNPGEKVKIQDAFSNKNNSLFIVISNVGDMNLLTVKAGDAYPNSMLGDIVIEIANGTSAIQIQDLSRFEKSDGSLDLDFGEDFTGTIYAVARWAGVKPLLQEDLTQGIANE